MTYIFRWEAKEGKEERGNKSEVDFPTCKHFLRTYTHRLLLRRPSLLYVGGPTGVVQKLRGQDKMGRWSIKCPFCPPLD